MWKHSMGHFGNMTLNFSMIGSLGGHKENDETMFIHFLCLCYRARRLAIMLNCNITKMGIFHWFCGFIRVLKISESKSSEDNKIKLWFIEKKKKKKNDIMETLLPMFSNVLCHFYYLAVTQRPISNRCTGHSDVFTKTFFGKYLTWLMFQNSFEGDVFSILLGITYHLVIKVQIRRAVSTAVSIVGPQHLIGNNFNVHWNDNKGK